jgi:hypothetical protein
MNPKNFFIFFTVCLGILYLAACEKATGIQKKEVPEPGVTKPDITGKWQWLQSTTGWGGQVKPATDTIVLLTLGSDSAYTLVINNRIVITGAFKTTISPTPDSSLVFNFGSGLQAKELRLRDRENVIYLKNDTCWLYDYLIADGTSHWFKRIR